MYVSDLIHPSVVEWTTTKHLIWISGNSMIEDSIQWYMLGS